jgi:hypothetical protein
MAPEGEYTKRGTDRERDSDRKLQTWHQRENTQREGLTERVILRENFKHGTRGRIHKERD